MRDKKKEATVKEKLRKSGEERCLGSFYLTIRANGAQISVQIWDGPLGIKCWDGKNWYDYVMFDEHPDIPRNF